MKINMIQVLWSFKEYILFAVGTNFLSILGHITGFLTTGATSGAGIVCLSRTPELITSAKGFQDFRYVYIRLDITDQC